MSVSKVLMDLVERVPLSDGLPFYNYGTAGFRFKAELMDGLMVRVGVLSMMLLLLDQEDPPGITDGNETDPSALSTGVMITASHNDESYNGVKLANPDGSMLTPPQEAFLTKWVNERDAQTFQQFLDDKATEIVEKFKAKQSENQTVVYVLNIGRDTRSHSGPLSALLIEGAKTFMGCVKAASTDTSTSLVPFEVRDRGILTTPMLHHIVLHSNSQYLPHYIEPKNTRKGYIETYAKAYVDLLKDLPSSSSESPLIPLRVDGACGVGYRAVQELIEEITKLTSTEDGTTATPLSVHNGELDGPLNDSCGSEHVQKQLQPPTWYASKNLTYAKNGTGEESTFPYCCSLDGDADRIVFFGQSSKTDLAQLLDGDKIAILIAHVLMGRVLEEKNRVAAKEAVDSSTPGIRIGIVQTAYANGASTNYVRNALKIPVETAKTGVKHLHHAAVEHFDIGIYFEANGHGTVVFSKAYEAFAQKCLEETGNPFFVQLHRLINPAVGDAVSDMLLVDYLLRSLGQWSLEDWNTKLYDDLSSRMLKVMVSDRTIIQCNSDESICLQPETVQPLLQTAMDKVSEGRCFVRPSGTEDVVRVYAEAETREEADSLANEAARIVFDTCAGVGTRP